MVKNIVRILEVTAVLYIIICIALYYLQEKLIFFPEKTEKNFQFHFDQPFEEMNIRTQDNKLLNGVLFKADHSKGLIFYLHGNAGSINSWADVPPLYTHQGYDVFLLDYRGYGKSEGEINNQQQFFQDVQTAYDTLKTRYTEDNIIVLGYSLGTGPAARVASANHPKLLILQAPYYSLTDIMKQRFPVIPTFILKYKFETGSYVKNCPMPIILFHGKEDEVIPYSSSLKIKKGFKNEDTLITLNGMGHNGMTENPEYRKEIQRILNH